jgi:histone-lysine N-methyltransferase SETD1
MKGSKVSQSGSTAPRRTQTDASKLQEASLVNKHEKQNQADTLQGQSHIPRNLVLDAVAAETSLQASPEHDAHTEPMGTAGQMNEPEIVNKRGSTRRHTQIDSHQDAPEKKRSSGSVASASPGQRQQGNDSIPPGGSVLYATEEGRNTTTRVKIFLEGSPFTSLIPGDVPELPQLGNDGNQFWCQVCHEFGDVVCCDGCPRVYHKECIPLDNAARTSLDRDEDPWYCPECIDDSVPTTFSEPDISPSKASLEDSDDGACPFCEDCGKKVEESFAFKTFEKLGNGRCSACQAAVETVGENNLEEENATTTRKSRRHCSSYPGDNINGDVEKGKDCDIEQDEKESKEEVDGGQRNLRKRRRADSVVSDKQADEVKVKTKKKQKGLKKNRDTNDQENFSINNLNHCGNEDERESFCQEETHFSDLVRATPAFYFYLAENRWKIERVLARKHRTFNRLPKGDERNELVAREAAMWWVKLRPVDHRRYMTMSMRDFEARTVEWKEEKSLREIVDLKAIDEQESNSSDDEIETVVGNGDRKDLNRRKRLDYACVGTKPVADELDDTQNKIAYELLHDLRFGKFPMVEASRDKSTLVMDDHAKSLIPYFEVHGPLSTSIGDECLGCTRGWKHYCHVLGRKLPAIEPRAKLQPPMSSLIATRVGLGLRPRVDRGQMVDEDLVDFELDHIQPISCTPSSDWIKLQSLPLLPSSSLGEALDRFDDVAVFIDDVTTMNSNHFASNGNTKASRASLFICGRCGAYTEDKAGCIRCRRAQLVYNLSKKQPAGFDSTDRTEADGNNLRVQTIMLGRIQGKDGFDDTRSKGEHQVSNRILKSRWAPLTILPPQVLLAPSKTRTFDCDEDEGDEKVIGLDDVDDRDRYAETASIGREDELVPEATIDIAPDAENTLGRCRIRNRQPPTRLLVSSTSNKDYSDPDRQKLMRKRERIDAFKSRCKAISCYGILLASLRRDPLRLVARTVKDQGFTAAFRDFIDIGTIKDNVLDQSYESVGDLVKDIESMCTAIISFYPCQASVCRYAKDIQSALPIAASRTADWMNAVLTAYQMCAGTHDPSSDAESFQSDDQLYEKEPFVELREVWPEAVEMLEDEEALRNQIEACIMRTIENEQAYYGALVVKRIAVAASATLAPNPDSTREHALVVGRDATFDRKLRIFVDNEVTRAGQLIDFHQTPSQKEELILNLLRKMQKRRIERKSHPENICSRCLPFDAIKEIHVQLDERRKRGDNIHHKISISRCESTTGLASTSNRKEALYWSEINDEELAGDVPSCLSVRPSRIHGFGLFADQHFKKGQIVAEYIGEYIEKETVARREEEYFEKSKPSFILRINDEFAIDATTKGGPARFLNHSCLPNCSMNFVKPPCKKCRERIFFVALKDIQIHDEITYDYKPSLALHVDSSSEEDLEKRIPCNCQSINCRGFVVSWIVVFDSNGLFLNLCSNFVLLRIGAYPSVYCYKAIRAPPSHEELS